MRSRHYLEFFSVFLGRDDVIVARAWTKHASFKKLHFKSDIFTHFKHMSQVSYCFSPASPSPSEAAAAPLASCHLQVLCVCVRESVHVLLMNASRADKLKGQLSSSTRVLQTQPHRNVICQWWITWCRGLISRLTFGPFLLTPAAQARCRHLLILFFFCMRVSEDVVTWFAAVFVRAVPIKTALLKHIRPWFNGYYMFV